MSILFPCQYYLRANIHAIYVNTKYLFGILFFLIAYLYLKGLRVLQNLLGRSTACGAGSRQVEPSAASMATAVGIHPLAPASGGKAHHRFNL
ncbi:MAG: hypothetical protein DRJ05_09855 [Bacteroidetes bacterium]|nr:MAG: hypothetical protein DRJ05_09855 [Bacteroidota bacterium]